MSLIEEVRLVILATDALKVAWSSYCLDSKGLIQAVYTHATMTPVVMVADMTNSVTLLCFMEFEQDLDLKEETKQDNLDTSLTSSEDLRFDCPHHLSFAGHHSV